MCEEPSKKVDIKYGFYTIVKGKVVTWLGNRLYMKHVT